MNKKMFLVLFMIFVFGGMAMAATPGLQTPSMIWLMKVGNEKQIKAAKHFDVSGKFTPPEASLQETAQPQTSATPLPQEASKPKQQNHRVKTIKQFHPQFKDDLGDLGSEYTDKIKTAFNTGDENFLPNIDSVHPQNLYREVKGL